jgi:hypothetical protein
MGVSDNNAVFGPDAVFTRQNLSFFVPAVAVSQAGLELWTHDPGYPFQILAFEVYCTAVVATAALDLLIESTDAMTQLTPVANIHTAGVINSDGTEYGDDDEEIKVTTTTNGSGEITAANIQVTIRRRAQTVE